MNYREFSRECQNRGFIKKGDSFYRCIGDGVFQHLYMGEKEKLPIDHVRWSPSHRYERSIAVHMKSMYASYEGPYKGIDSIYGLRWSVDELLGSYTFRFAGAEEAFERMCAEGFQVLDGIVSQQDLEAFLTERYNPDKTEPRYSIQFYDIYLFCGLLYKARMAVMTDFAVKCFMLHTRNRIDPALSEEVKKYNDLYFLTWPKYSDAARQRLRENYERNAERLRRIGVI